MERLRSVISRPGRIHRLLSRTTIPFHLDSSVFQSRSFDLNGPLRLPSNQPASQSKGHNPSKQNDEGNKADSATTFQNRT